MQHANFRVLALSLMNEAKYLSLWVLSMPSLKPQDILPQLQLIRAALATGLLTKDEVIDWAIGIVAGDEHPDIFFIDLALSGSLSVNDIITQFSRFLNFDGPTANGRALLGLLCKQYQETDMSLEQAIIKLYALKSEAKFSGIEESNIYSLENAYDLAKHNVYGSIPEVKQEFEQFLFLYKEYAIDDPAEWERLDRDIDHALNEIDRRERL